ncbi:glutamic acid-rich protein-like [Camellia sinensis]|uniref:glutamic acid-rich protein-like n=1 Tax=Camellia sinensis TaxID=4442 RepID=UPI001036A8D8|nr:glutamic acid-rich protein-like [Camellia sinensis]
MIKNLKAKERKEKQHDPEFQYPKVAKVTRASKQAGKQVEQSTKDKEVLDADAYVLPQPINITKSWIDNKQLVKNSSEEFYLGKKTKKELKKAILIFKETLQDPSKDEGNEQVEDNTEEYEASNGQEHQACSTEEETSEEIEPEDSEQEDEEENEQQEENKDESDEEENNEPMDQKHDES